MILKKQNVSQSSTAISDLIKEFKRQALIDYITAVFQGFLNTVVESGGMDVQVGVGSKSAYYRVFPVLSHFITDNMQAIELSGVNMEHCRMCLRQHGKSKDFSYFSIGKDRCLERNFLQQKEVCSEFSKYESIRIKNIAEGHNSLSLSAKDRAGIKKFTELKKKWGCLPNVNHLYDLPAFFTESPGNSDMKI